MQRKIAQRIQALTDNELRSFILERRDVGDFDKLEQQRFALELLCDRVSNEGYERGRYACEVENSL